MLETKDLVLDKAKFSDWEAMYHNVWSRPECAKYMFWKISTSEDEAKARILKTIKFQESHDTYLVYLKSTGESIGFAGVEKISPFTYEEAGICLGADYFGRGYGRQILQVLLQYCKNEHGAREFLYYTRTENEASKRLAESMGFEIIGTEEREDSRDGRRCTLIKYRLAL